MSSVAVLPVLNAVLFVGTVGWLVLAAVLLLDRLQYSQRSRRVALLRQRLTEADGPGLDRLAAEVKALDVDDLILEGVPPAVETALGRALLSDGRRSAVLGSARGADGGDVWTRIRAAQVLASARDSDAHTTLDTMVRSGDRVLAAAALRLFVRLDDRRSADLMIRALVDHAYSRSRIAAAFTALSDAHADTLQPLFSSKEPSCRYWAARLACFNRMHQWAPNVRELTTDADPFVRRAAVEAVGAIGAPGDAGVVLDLFSDPVPIVRAHAARAAAAFSGPHHAMALRQLLNDSAWIVRSAAAEALGTSPLSGGNIAAT